MRLNLGSESEAERAARLLCKEGINVHKRGSSVEVWPDDGLHARRVLDAHGVSIRSVGD